MSTTLERPQAGAGKGTAGSPLYGLPQVNLLPPEVRAARSLGVLKRWLAIALVLVLALIGLGYGAAYLATQSAEDELAEAQAETTRLQSEEAKYAEVPQVLGAIDSTETARLLGMSSEIRWKTYLDAVTAVLPGGVSIDQFTMTGPALDAAAAPITATDPLQQPSIGSISFQGQSRTVPDTAAWVDALASVPGFVDPWVSSVSVTEEDGAVYYSVTSTVQLTDQTLANRFVPTEEEG
jgi:Tfp pilus assembly protein PilN